MAVATGAIVANLYYAQPLLHRLEHVFGASPLSTSLVVTSAQAGYALALVLVVPLGDIRPRRRLVVTIFAVAVGALALCAASPTLWVFAGASLLTGIASVAGQVMIPLAADLATPARRGRTVARVMTGLLVGILLARTLSGIVAQLAGWRAVYWLSAGLMALLAAVLARALPAEPPRASVPYATLVLAPLRLLGSEPVLRRRALYGATAFGTMSVLWTSLAFLLSGAPFHYSELVIGLFGLAGVAGVAAANLAGRLADAARAGVSTAVAAVLMTGAFGVLFAGRSSLAFLVAGIVLADAGAQAMHITNQSIVYELAPRMRSRVNSAYMTCCFAGAAAGSVTAGTVWAAARWGGVSLLGAGFGAVAVALAAAERLRRRSAAGSAPLLPATATARSAGPGRP